MTILHNITVRYFQRVNIVQRYSCDFKVTKLNSCNLDVCVVVSMDTFIIILKAGLSAMGNGEI